MRQNERRRKMRERTRERLWPSVVMFVGLFSLWLMLSGHLDALHLSFGAISAALVVVLTRDVERIGARIDRRGRRVPMFTFSFPWLGFLLYLPWLLGQMVMANLQIAYVILHPRLPIRPTVVRFPAELPGDLARTAFGNSITLTPGTITIDVVGEEFTVHALTGEAARQVLSRAMERRVARAFATDDR